MVSAGAFSPLALSCPQAMEHRQNTINTIFFIVRLFLPRSGRGVFPGAMQRTQGSRKLAGSESGAARESTEVMQVTASLDYERKAGLELRIPEPATAVTMASAKRSAAAGWELKNRAGSINSSSMMRNWSLLSLRSTIPSTRAYSVGGAACSAHVAHSSTGAGGSAARDLPPKSLCTRKSPGFGVLRTA